MVFSIRWSSSNRNCFSCKELKQVEIVEGPLSGLAGAYEALKKATEYSLDDSRPNQSATTYGSTEREIPTTVNLGEVERMSKSTGSAGTGPMRNVLGNCSRVDLWSFLICPFSALREAWKEPRDGLAEMPGGEPLDCVNGIPLEHTRAWSSRNAWG